MAGLKLEIQGIEKTIKELERFGVEGEKAVSDSVEQAARFIAREAKDIHKPHIDTGKLHQSIIPQQEGKTSWNVTANATGYAPYAPYIEFGWTSSKGKQVGPFPFLYPAWRKGIKVFNRDLKDALKILSNKFNK